jgi:hypothetical protein
VNAAFTRRYGSPAIASYMEMNFPHRQYGQATPAKGSEYTLILAAAAARQLLGVTARLATADVVAAKDEVDSISARISYFGQKNDKAAPSVRGAFLPVERASVAAKRNYEDAIYCDASANGKKVALDMGLSDDPAAMRGMED